MRLSATAQQVSLQEGELSPGARASPLQISSTSCRCLALTSSAPYRAGAGHHLRSPQPMLLGRWCENIRRKRLPKLRQIRDSDAPTPPPLAGVPHVRELLQALRVAEQARELPLALRLLVGAGDVRPAQRGARAVDLAANTVTRYMRQPSWAQGLSSPGSESTEHSIDARESRTENTA